MNAQNSTADPPNPEGEPIRKTFLQELDLLQSRLLGMTALTDKMLEEALDSLLTGDLAKAKAVVRQDAAVDALELEIENQCLNLIALQQPVAHDLRVIGVALKAITDIERIGDLAADIAKAGRRLTRAKLSYDPLVDIPELFALTRQMLALAVNALTTNNLEEVFAVIRFDNEIDWRYVEMRDTLMDCLALDNSQSVMILNLLFITTYLENVCDHIVAIAARVHFLITGEFLRPNDVA